VNALGIDATAWFQEPGLRGHLSVRHWRRLPARGAEAMAAAFAACRELDVRATWFVPGDAVLRAGELLRALVDAGHEVAFAGTSTVPLATMTPAERDAAMHSWLAALVALEAATGRAVRGFRAAWPGDAASTSGTAGGTWWQAWPREHGFAYDATPLPTDGTAVRIVELSGDRSCDAVGVAAWWFDAGIPSLAGLPPAIAAAHRARVGTGPGLLATRVNRGEAGTIAARLGIAKATPPIRSALAVAPLASSPPPSSAPRLAIIVPLKDEEAGIASLALELDAVARDLADVAACEFVFVDDGSRDRTWQLLRTHFGERAHCTLVQHEHNRGVAAAIHTGIRATDAPLVASIDGDLSYDPAELRAMLALAQAEAADVVTASPYHPRGGARNVPSWRLFLSRSLSAAYRRLLRSPLHTWTACFRVYRRAAVADLPVAYPGFLGTAELLVRVLRRGGKVVEHPCVLEARLLGTSKMRVLRTIRGHVGLLWQVLRRRVT
jgi:hypothetical protein